MSFLGGLAMAWLVLSLGTLLFLSALAARAFRRGGSPAVRKLQLGVPFILLALVLSSLVWPWTWWTIRRLGRPGS